MKGFTSLLSAKRGAEQHSALSVARNVFAMVPWVRRVTVAMAVLGVLAGLSETVGLTLVVAMMFSLGTDQAAEVAPLSLVSRLTGGPLSTGMLAAVLVAAILAKIGLTLANSLWGSVVANRVNENIRNRLYDQLLDLSVVDMGRYDGGELITILTSESYEVSSAHAAIVRSVINAVTIVAFVAVLLATSWQVGIIAIAMGLFHSFVIGRFSATFHRLGQETSQVLEEMTRISWGALQAVKALRAYGVQDQYRTTFAGLSRRSATKMTHVEQYNAYTVALSEFMVFVLLLAIIVITRSMEQSFVPLVASAVLLLRLQPYVRELDGNLLRLIRADTPVDRIRKLLETADKHYVKGGDTPLANFTREIEFIDVAFRYPDSPAPAVEHVSFKIPAGSRTAIVGRSGSGKTTIINLLLGLDVPTEGKILVDGVDLSVIRLKDWNRLTAVAGQDVELVEGTIAENISFSRPFSRADVERAAVLAGAERYIRLLPDGYDEWAGEGAIRLSGGQRQRLGVARGLVGHPEILILDEATSGLDEETEQEVIESIIREFKNSTIVLVTHRKSTLKYMDRIIDIDRKPGGPEEQTPGQA